MELLLKMSDPNVDAVCVMLQTRAEVGLKKYGVDTTRQDLTQIQWLRHAQEEALDLAVYLQRVITDLEKLREHPTVRLQQM